MAYPYGTNPYPYSGPYVPQMTSTAMPYQPQPQQQPNQNGFIAAWVQGGEQSMKSFPLGPNQKVFLFSTEENIFGIKSTDANGMPYPLEMFRYERIGNAPRPQPAPQVPTIDTSSFVTRDELEARIADLTTELNSTPAPREFASNRQQRNNQNGGDQKHGK